MPLLSPGVLIKEKDFTTIVPNVATAIGGIAGDFSQGPLNTPILITSENKLAEVFGQPTETNYATWFTAAEFLGYTNKLWVVRAIPAECKNACQTGSIVHVTKNGTFTQSTGSSTVNIKIVNHGYEVADNLALIFTDDGATPPDDNYAVATVNGAPVATSSGSSTGTVATINTATAHGLVNGDYATIAGVTPAGYNGTVVITKVDNDTFTYTLPNAGHDLVAVSVQGTVTDINTLTVTTTLPAGEDKIGDVQSTLTTISSIQVANFEDYEAKWPTSLDTAGTFIAKQPGIAGNALKVVLVDAGNYTLTKNDTAMVDYSGKSYTDYMPGEPGTSLYTAGRAIAESELKSDELSVLIIDATGEISGKANTVLEVFNYASKAFDAIDYKNTSLYYADVVNTQSAYVYFNKHPSSSIEVSDNITTFGWGKSAFDVANTGDKFADLTAVLSYTLSGGDSGTTPEAADIIDAYDELKNPEDLDVNLLITGNHPTSVIAHVCEMAATRKDCVAFLTPHNNGARYTNRATMTTDILAFKDSLNVADMFHSYCVIDTGFKYMFDPYNRRYRWIPLNGDIAGICARTDELTDPWWSPGGFNRGGVRNIIKLSYNPNQAERDILYPKGVNPVVTFPGSGTVLFGDRTMQAKPSAFDRINVRRLFIVLEKAISTAAKYQLFEFNDSFTRAQFKNMVEPFLRDVQGRRGITDFKVICDESNNTGEVIDRNEFIADIYVKPARSINFIYLNFIATKTGVDFSTVIGG